MAFDVASAQRLATPVTSMYRGRALRMAEKQAEQDMRLASQQEELNSLKLDAMRNPQPDPEEQRKADKARRERATEMIAFGEDTARRTFSMYEQAKKAGKSEEEARAVAQEIMNQDMQFASELYGKELARRIDPDGVWTPEEAQAAIAQIKDLVDKQPELGDAVVFRDATGKPVGTARKNTPKYDELLNQGHFPGVNIGRPEEEIIDGPGDNDTIKIPPRPTANEREQASRALGDAFKELGGDDREKALDWITDRAKEIQHKSGKKFQDALNDAVTEGRSHVRTEKDGGFAWFDKAVFEPYENSVEWNGETFTKGQEITRNGVQYVVVGFEGGEPLVERK